MSRMCIEIESLYDGIAFYFYPKTKEFVWVPEAIERTTEKYRKEFQQEFLKQFE